MTPVQPTPSQNAPASAPASPRAARTARRGAGAPRAASHTRTCIGCGAHDDPAAMVHVVVYEGVVVIDAVLARGGGLPAGVVRGRGAHVHPRVACLGKAPGALARSLRRPATVTAQELGRAVAAACERRMEGLLISARRLGAVSSGADAALDAAKAGAPLVVVAADAGAVARTIEVGVAVAAGRAIGWRSKADLGRLLGHVSVAICAVRHGAIAAELMKLRAAADAAAGAASVTSETGEEARCRRPEGR